MNDYETPVQRYLRNQQAQRNYVPAAAPIVKREQTVDVIPQWLATAQPVDLSAAWEPLQTAKENTSAVDRARGLQMRLAPFLALYGLAGVVVGGVVWYVAGTLPGAALLAVVTFAALGIFTYRRMNLDDYDHSASGVERHRIDQATYLAERELEHKARMQEKALDAYIRQMENRNR